MNYKDLIFERFKICALLCSFLLIPLQAKQIRNQGLFLDRAADHKITVAYIYDGCRHEKAAQCPTRKPVYHANKKTFNNVSTIPELCSADVYFTTIDSSRYRVKNLKKFLSLTDSDTFIVFIDGIVASYDYLTGSPTETELLTYIKKIAGDEIRQCSNHQCTLKIEDYNRGKASHQEVSQRPSWYAPGYYGVMGGPPPLGYGMGMSGYSFSMGYRMSPFMY